MTTRQLAMRMVINRSVSLHPGDLLEAVRRLTEDLKQTADANHKKVHIYLMGIYWSPSGKGLTRFLNDIRKQAA